MKFLLTRDPATGAWDLSLRLTELDLMRPELTPQERGALQRILTTGERAPSASAALWAAAILVGAEERRVLREKTLQNSREFPQTPDSRV